MKRRDFIKSVGVAGAIALLGTIPFDGTCASAGRSSRHDRFDPDAAGDGGFQGPFGVTLDGAGSLLVTDPPGYRVVRLDSSHTPVFSFGKPGAHPGLLNFPKGIAVDAAGLIYVVDSNNCRVQVFGADGKVIRVMGSVGSIGGSFATPQGVFVDTRGRIFVSDTRNHRIQIFEQSNLIAVIGDLGDGKDQFSPSHRVHDEA